MTRHDDNLGAYVMYTAQLEEEFQDQLLKDCDECAHIVSLQQANVGRKMIQKNGAVEATKLLVRSGDGQKGFLALMEKGLSCFTMEYRITEERFRKLFATPDDIANNREPGVIAIAKWRLANWEALPRKSRW